MSTVASDASGGEEDDADADRGNDDSSDAEDEDDPRSRLLMSLSERMAEMDEVRPLSSHQQTSDIVGHAHRPCRSNFYPHRSWQRRMRGSQNWRAIAGMTEVATTTDEPGGAMPRWKGKIGEVDPARARLRQCL